MGPETTFEEKVKELEDWIANHNSLPLIIGKSTADSRVNVIKPISGY